MSELLVRAGGLGKYSEVCRDPAWRGIQVILIVLFVATKGFLFYLSNTTNTAQSSSVLHDAT